eukprot:maker-scaffold_4-snap-gene-0.5-mRNA-1 protein AED:0.21 eAED:0.21 QI:375/1/1/1/0.71/0.5/8/155/293
MSFQESLDKLTKGEYEVIFKDESPKELELEDFADAMKNNTKVEILKFKNISLDDDQLERLTDFIPEDGTLSTLTFEDNELGDSGAKIIAEALAQNQYMTFRLLKNDVRDRGADAISKVLRLNQKLRLVILSGNQIGDKGVKSLCSALSDNNFVDTLDLSENPITDKSASYFKELFGSNNQLSALFLSGTRLSNDCLEEFAEGVEENPALTLIEFPTKIDEPEKLMRIETMLKNNSDAKVARMASTMQLQAKNKEKKKLGLSPLKIKGGNANIKKKSSRNMLKNENIFGGLERI